MSADPFGDYLAAVIRGEVPSRRVEAGRHDRQSSARVVHFTRADLVEMRPTPWLLDGWLVQDTLAGLVAPSGACKSFLAVAWACHVATGAPWFGRDVCQGAVFYLAGEGRQGLRKRIAAWEQASGVSVTGAPLFLADSLPFLCEEANALGVVEAISAEAERLYRESASEPALVVIDTVARAMSGANENSAEDMGQFVKAMDWLRGQWGATVLSVHHTGLDPAAQGRARGSSAYRAALDSEFIIEPGDPELRLVPTKCKDWRPPASLTLRKVEVPVELPQADGSALRETSLVLHDAAGAVLETQRREKVLELAAQGLPQRAIAERTGVPKSTVARWLKP